MVARPAQLVAFDLRRATIKIPRSASWIYFLSASSLWIFWLGGITFYISVVVPLGGSVLGADTQGMVTRHVTRVINGLAVPVGGVILVHAIQRRRRCFWLIALLHFAMLACLWFLHGELSARSDQGTGNWFADWSFYDVHRIYLWLSTIQWANAMVAHFLFLVNNQRGVQPS